MKKENLTATIVRTLIENARAKRKNIIENTDDEDDDSGDYTVSKGPNHLVKVGPEGGVWGHFNGKEFGIPDYHEYEYEEPGKPITHEEIMDKLKDHPHRKEIADLLKKLEAQGKL